jgi:excisionase family DNA binding protein
MARDPAAATAVTRPRRSRSRAHAAERLERADRRLAGALPLSDIDDIVAEAEHAAELVDAPGSARVSKLTGDVLPGPREMARIRRANLLRAFSERRALLAEALSVAEVAELLGVGRQTPHDRVKAGTLLAVKENGKLIFPDWQFDPDGADGVLVGLPEVLRAIQGPISPMGRIRWFVTPKPLMDGRAPLEALRAGDVDIVVREAQAIGVS